MKNLRPTIIHQRKRQKNKKRFLNEKNSNEQQPQQLKKQKKKYTTNGKICKANSRRTFSKCYWLGCWYSSLPYLERFARAKKLRIEIVYYLFYYYQRHTNTLSIRCFAFRSKQMKYMNVLAFK